MKTARDTSAFNWMLLYFVLLFTLAVFLRRALSAVEAPMALSVSGSVTAAALLCYPVARRAFSTAFSKWVLVHLGIALLVAGVLWYFA